MPERSATPAQGVQTVEKQTTPTRHYHHQLPSKGVCYRFLVGYYAIGHQIEAYDGRRRPYMVYLALEGGGSLVFFFFCAVVGRL